MEEVTPREISRERRPIDFNELFNTKGLKEIAVGKCLSSPDGKIMACRTDDNEWVIDSNTEKFKGKIKITDL